MPTLRCLVPKPANDRMTKAKSVNVMRYRTIISLIIGLLVSMPATAEREAVRVVRAGTGPDGCATYAMAYTDGSISEIRFYRGQDSFVIMRDNSMCKLAKAGVEAEPIEGVDHEPLD